MNATEKDVLDRFKALLLQRVPVYKMILFGSRARGNAAPDSDMDVVVVVNDSIEESASYISDCAWEAGFDQGIVIVPVVFSRDEWENSPERSSLLAQAVALEGIAV